MASFVPHYRKKQLQLQEVEAELLALLQKGAAEEKVLRAAEEVQQARVRALKEKMATFAPSEKNARVLERLRNEIELLLAATVSAILQEYRQKAADLKSPVVIPRAPRRGD